MSWWKSDKTLADEAVTEAHNYGQKIGSEDRNEVWNNPVNDLRISEQSDREREAYHAGYEHGKSQR